MTTNYARVLCKMLGALMVTALLMQVASAQNKPRNTTGLRVITAYYGADESSLMAQLHPGDMVVVFPPKPELDASKLPKDPEHWIRQAVGLNQEHPKLKLIFNFDGIEQMQQWTPKLPKWIRWISYDYERWDTTPEFSIDQAQTLKYMDEARQIARRNGKKLFLTPVPFFDPRITEMAVRAKYLPGPMKPWQFSELVKRGDAFNAQFQFMGRQPDWIQSTVHEMSETMRKESPKTELFIQMGKGGGPRPLGDEELEKVVQAITTSGADGVVIWFGPGQSDWAEKVLTMIRPGQKR